MISKAFFLIFFVLFTTLSAAEVEFQSSDDLTVYGELHRVSKEKGFILLFHQANSSLGEYATISPKLNKMGFSTLAIDQRSGSSMNNVPNKTAQLAKTEGYKTSYWDAREDLIASVKWVKDTYNPKKIIVWGSSYSAALVFTLADDPTVKPLISAYLAFSPGEYLGKHKVVDSAKNIDKAHVFITSAKSETANWRDIYAAIPSPNKVSYLPKTQGNHGSSALFLKYSDAETYWVEVVKFLSEL